MTIRIDLENGYSETFATMAEARAALIAARNAGVEGAIDADGVAIWIGDETWQAWAGADDSEAS